LILVGIAAAGIGFTTEAQRAQRRTESGVNRNNNFSLFSVPSVPLW